DGHDPRTSKASQRRGKARSDLGTLGEHGRASRAYSGPGLAIEGTRAADRSAAEGSAARANLGRGQARDSPWQEVSCQSCCQRRNAMSRRLTNGTKSRSLVWAKCFLSAWKSVCGPLAAVQKHFNSLQKARAERSSSSSL